MKGMDSDMPIQLEYTAACSDNFATARRERRLLVARDTNGQRRQLRK